MKTKKKMRKRNRERQTQTHKIKIHTDNTKNVSNSVKNDFFCCFFFIQIRTEYKDKMFTGRVVATEPPRFHITDDEATITGKFLGSALIEKNGKTISIMDISGVRF